MTTYAGSKDAETGHNDGSLEEALFNAPRMQLSVSVFVRLFRER